MGLIASMFANKPPSLRVKKTGPSTHVVEVNSISKLREEYHRRSGERSLSSPTFTVDGLNWMVWCDVDGEGDKQGYIGVHVYLATEGAVAWARVKIGLVDWTSGRTDTLYPGESDDDDPVLFDAGSDDCSSWGTDKLASWGQQLRGSRYLRHDCLKVECVIDVCHSQLAFPDPPVPRSTPRHVEITGELGSFEGADVFIHVVGAIAEPIPAHSSVMDAYAPRFLKKHNLGKRRRRKTATAAAAMRVDVDGVPRQAVEAFLRFIYTGTLPVVDGLSANGYRDMFWHLLLAGERYGMQRLCVICDRVLRNSIDVESAVAMLTTAHRHGFQEIKKAFLEFASHPENYGLVQLSEGYAKLMCSENFSLVREVWAKYYENERLPNMSSGSSPSLR